MGKEFLKPSAQTEGHSPRSDRLSTHGPAFHRTVAAGGGDRLAIRSERDRRTTFAALERCKVLAALIVEELNRSVFMDSCKCPTVPGKLATAAPS